MPVEKLKKCLDDHHIRYVTIRHSPAFTAQEVAASAHIPGKELAKTVVVNLDGELALAVLPASAQVDLDRLKEAAGAQRAELAIESEFRSSFGDCDIGAMPPFGNLYGMEVYVASRLAEDEEIAFNAGTHTELVKMAYKDFEKVVKPKVVGLATVTA
jgi:Ala-tRNA(Pro) deacylase